MALGAAAVKGVGSVVSGISGSAQASQQAAALDRNAALSDQQAGQVYAQGVARESAQRAQAGQQLGEQRAAVAESGFNPNVGSALDVQVQSVRNAELDALQTRYQSILQGGTLEDQARQDRYAARTARASANNSLIAGGISAAAGLLGGFGNYAKGNNLLTGNTGGLLKTYGTTTAGNPLLFTMP
ncbi:hypothetical protein [Burkholderia multivorans]|uniref:hypothetical protein n=1 Tax=Burkholderia multivorans TaxID=87883 RepID=UPI0011B28E58|nr:hypothetical protein [Burkholderia multivorans]MBN6728216.1 hypothetical protein [Burkholderia multivorans]MBU9340448.1 hypothetical protein [Burkholderia multivorans]QGR60184.1 hypothetical protein FOC27_08105 [Burkholderia multivorans]